MINYFEFKNKGEIPVNAFKLLGASTKRDQENKIGFFGTGLKYALAVCLREGINFKVFIGKKELKIGTVKTEFGGKEVSIMTIDGEKTSITTEAGIDWEPWFAIREIYSNAVDEGGVMELVSKINPLKEHTTVYIELSEKLGDVSKNWQHYFAFRRKPIFANNHYRLLPKLGDSRFTVFRRGIRTYHSPDKNSLFDYDVQYVKINESRVVVHTWEAKQRAAETLAQCPDIEAISTFVNSWKQSDKYIEHDPDFWTYMFDYTPGFLDLDSRAMFIATQNYTKGFSSAWLSVLKNKRIIPSEQSGFYGITKNSVCLPENLIKKLYNQFGDKLTLLGHTKEHYSIESKYSPIFDEAHNLLNKFGYTYDKDKIKIAKFKDNSILGMYDSDKDLVLLSKELLSPTQSLRRTQILFEEIAHAKSGFSDQTRAFQDYIIDIAVGLMKDSK